MRVDGTASPAAGQSQCLHCGYDLRALPEPRCPECGRIHDPVEFARQVKLIQRRRLLLSGVTMTLAMYAPYAWLLFMDYPWSGYRWQWIRMWPGLPLLLLSSLSGVRGILHRWLRLDSESLVSTLLLSVLSLLLLYGLIHLGARGWKRLVITAVVLLALSVVNSLILHGLFLM